MDWFARAACRGKTRLFFGEERAPYWEARIICAGCEVRQNCLDFALTNRETEGMWGGYSPRERERIRRKRNRFLKQGAA